MSRSEEMHQCLLYDSYEKNARLIGVEYIVSDRIYRELPDAEKKYWHPHTYEVLAGGLIAPSMKPDDEQAFMKACLTTWGKTWHTWPDPSTPVPMGEPLLMWAVTGDGQLDDEVIAAATSSSGSAPPTFASSDAGRSDTKSRRFRCRVRSTRSAANGPTKARTSRPPGSDGRRASLAMLACRFPLTRQVAFRMIPCAGRQDVARPPSRRHGGRRAVAHGSRTDDHPSHFLAQTPHL